MAMAVGDLIEVVIKGQIHNQTTLTVFHYYVSGASTTPDLFDELENVLDEFLDMGVGSFLPTWLSVVPSSWNLRTISTQKIAPVRSRRVVSATQNEAGLGSDSGVTNVQGAITFQTDFAGRRFIGGVRVPMSPADAFNGSWSALTLGKLEALAQEFGSPFTEPGGDGIYQPCIYHRDLAPPSNRTDITAVLVQPTTRVIRRRTVGLGI